MKACHLAALLAVGWYLMIPPPKEAGNIYQTNQFETDFSAPLSQWAEFRLFDHPSQCESTREAYKRVPPRAFVIMLGGEAQARATMSAARCIATDDPRLKQDTRSLNLGNSPGN